MTIDIKRVDTTLPLPTYATAGSVGFDLICRQETRIAPQKLGFIPGNVIVKTPHGYMLLVTLRSSTPRRKGLLIPHGVGVIDQDYSGEGDEVIIQVYNFDEEPVTIDRGERIAQGIFVPVLRAEWREVDEVGIGRGGFGSTGESVFTMPVRPFPGRREVSTQLSERELEVLAQVKLGRKNREIADVLAISEATVHKHLQNIFGKLKARNRMEAVALAQKGA